VDHRTDGGRVAIVIRPLDRFLNGLRLVSVPVIALMAGISTVRILTWVLEFSPGNWLLALVAAVVVVAYLWVMKKDAVEVELDRVLGQARRQIALGCNHDETHVRGRLRLRCRLMPDVFRVPLFPYDEQTRAISELKQACDDGRSDRYWFVEGESGSGKTRTVFRLIQTLARDRRLFELGNRCYLYDFSESQLVQDAFLGKLGSVRHEDAVVFVDNFQHVRADIVAKLTRRLLEGSEEPPERLVVFLARRADAWNLGSKSDARLLSEAKANDRYIKLEGVSPNTVARSVSESDKGASELIRELENKDRATAAQLHLAQVIARHHRAPAEVLGMLHLLTRKMECAQLPELVCSLAMIAALSIHRGAISRRELRDEIHIAARAIGARFEPLMALRIRLMFGRLRRIGIVQLDEDRFLFHEGIAELCVDRLFGKSLFRDPFIAVGRSRLEARQAEGDDLTAWLMAAEIGDEATLVTNFDAAALGHGAYQRMARCLGRASSTKRYELPPPARLQLAILLDRIGDFEASRAEYTDDLLQALSSSNQLAIVLSASRIEASHDHASEMEIDAMCRNPDPVAKIIGKYWRLHIDGHGGHFNSAGMLDLASKLLGLAKGKETHWLTYSLARMHFDSLRQHYLEGGLPVGAIESCPRRALDAYLEGRLPTHEALHVLYGQAHLVGHVLLPKLAIFGEPIAPEEVAPLEAMGSSDVATVEALMTTVRRLYLRATEEFRQYGDREAEYLQADVLNAEMIQSGADLVALKARLYAYQQFILETGFEAIFSYPHFYLFRWSMLKHYQAYPIHWASESSVSSEYLDEAAWQLERIDELDAAVRNRYGLMRSEMMATLLRAVRAPISQNELACMAKRMEGAGYGFETRLLRHFATRPVISYEELGNVFRFYPFVHQ